MVAGVEFHDAGCATGELALQVGRAQMPLAGIVSRGSAVERRLLLIRFAQTQFDDLFAPEQTSAPLATPGE